MGKKGSFPVEVLREAKLRNMRPEDYVRERADCEQAEHRLAEIDRKKLEEMQPQTEEEPVST